MRLYFTTLKMEDWKNIWKFGGVFLRYLSIQNCKLALDIDIICYIIMCIYKSQVQLKTPQLEFILGKPYWSSSSRENSWWQLAMNFPRRFSRSDNLALVTETRHTSKQMLCSIVSFEWFLMKCDAKASVLPSYLLPRCEIPTFFSSQVCNYEKFK